ncbi:hypothetical protein HYQ45_005707 [Verticillium longisporum]|uniref:Gfo/Idh/MocA-like oxidoreductase C-terminal domain-containing protein n=1 Tax=Verticillium longisporum TaxID=100787 RepID=A0A8I2ZRB5_VERLO|nr:hypothetical protein HYQ45_005707 [Verticillium longisporum]
MSFTLRWGILATGWIAETFSKDLLTNPATRDVSDVAHRIVAVSSSRDAQKARDFLTKIDGPQEAKTYGSYAELILYHLQAADAKEKPVVTAALNKYAATGADDSTAIIVRFPKHNTLGIATTSLRADTDASGAGKTPGIRIQGSKGEIQVAHPAFRPDSYRVVRKGAAEGEVEIVECPLPKDESRGGWGHGFFWEADEAARCVRDGKVQSEGMPWEESVVIMEVMDEALRQGGVEYPALITSHEFDPESSLNTGR